MLPLLLSMSIVAAVAASPAPVALPVAPVPFGLFAPSDMSWTLGAAFSPDSRTVYYTKSESGLVGTTIFTSTLVFGRWTPPDIASFSGQFADSDPAATPDGTAIVFASHRPPLGSATTSGLYEAFVAGPRNGTVVPLPNSENALGAETSPSIARDGTLYFVANVRGTRRIYRVPSVSEQSTTAVAVALPGDADGIVDRDVTIDPAQRFAVFSSTRPGGLGSFDLYLAFRSGDRWCAPILLPAPVNSASNEIAPSLARDGTTLYFASNRSDVTQPSDPPMDSAAFAAALAHYQDGAVRLFSTNIAPWLQRFAGAAAC